MSSTLRDSLRLTSMTNDAELKRVCTEYYALYRNIFNTTRDPAVRELARLRMSELEEAAKQESIKLSYSDICSSAKPGHTPAGAAAAALSDAGGRQLTQSEAKRLESMISAMPDSAEKYYMTATYQFYTSAYNEQVAKNVSDNIRYAHQLDSENPTYSILLTGIRSAVTQYEHDLDAWRKQKQLENEKEMEDEIKRARRKKLWNGTKTAGGVILTILGAIAAAAVAVVGFLCECFSGCDC